jgi:hypothetical protein
VTFVLTFHGSLGVELAVDFLVFDAVAWNIWIGIYQAFKTVPEPLLEVSDNYNLGFFRKMRTLLIPHSIPRLTSNVFSSFADAFFYISVSEVFAAGAATAGVCPTGSDGHLIDPWTDDRSASSGALNDGNLVIPVIDPCADGSAGTGRRDGGTVTGRPEGRMTAMTGAASSER